MELLTAIFAGYWNSFFEANYATELLLWNNQDKQFIWKVFKFTLTNHNGAVPEK